MEVEVGNFTVDEAWDLGGGKVMSQLSAGLDGTTKRKDSSARDGRLDNLSGIIQDNSLEERSRVYTMRSEKGDPSKRGSFRSTDILMERQPNWKVKPDTERWQKGIILGRGSYGSVYEAVDIKGVFFAVKEVSMLGEGSQGELSIDQLEQEIALLKNFEHKNIVQYYGTKKDEENLYIFQGLATEGSVLKVFEEFNFQESEVPKYTREILCGLKYLHDRKVVHRNIKCANILAYADCTVKIADSGWAKATKSIKGTARWAAPEVVKREPYGLPADIWSLGCTILEMLTRQPPYSDLEEPQVLSKIWGGIPPPIPDYVSKDARNFICQCLQAEAHYRPTATQLLDHPFLTRTMVSAAMDL